MTDAIPEPVLLTTYTGARRYPKVVGVIMGWVSPWPSTAAQMGLMLGLAVALLWTRPVWGAFVPAPLQVIIVMAVPLGGWWAVRFWKPEGREPAQALSGLVAYLCRPRLGVVNGRPLRPHRGVAVTRTVFIRSTA